MAIDVTLIPGDGIGPEITAATLKVLEATGLDWSWDRQLGGLAAVEASGDPLPKATLDSIRRTRLALKGPLTTPVGSGFRSVNVALRKEFSLYANVRPAKDFIPGGRYDDVDIVLVRENLEGLYIGLEKWIPVGDDPHGRAESIAVVTREGSERVVRYAFDYALRHGRKKVTLVHKANILKYTSGLFLQVGREIAAEYDGRIECNDLIIDNCAMQLVMLPEQFDVIVTTNLFGDILSDEISGLVGGLGLAPGGNIGSDAAIFEAVHGSAPDIAGQGIANPSALILAAAMMCDHIGEPDAADRIRRAVTATIVADRVRTRDLGGKASTEEFGAAVARRVG
jgi:isocitrate dehydrogenase (NAD+)